MNGNRNSTGERNPNTYNAGFRTGQTRIPYQNNAARPQNGNYYGQERRTVQGQTQGSVRNPSGGHQMPGGARSAGQMQRQYPYGQRPPQGNVRRTAPVPDNRWIPLFSGLLALFIIVGIIFTVSKAKERKKAVNASDAGNEAYINTDDTESSDEENEIELSPLASSYAVRTDKTVELGDEISSEYAIMIDQSNNTVIAEKNPDTLIYPASMTKIMTLIVAYENCTDLNDTFTMTQKITDEAYKAGASVAGFMPGEKVSIRDLLYGAILPSGADATAALAEYIGGDEEGFVELMNRKILKLGLSNTHFTNSSGLHDKDHYSTPHEMALIFEYALKIDECREVLSAYKYKTASTPEHPDGIELTSTMFSRMAGDESGTAEVLAGKTGYTNEALHCLASLARAKNGTEYVLITAYSPSTYGPIFDCIDLCKSLLS